MAAHLLFFFYAGASVGLFLYGANCYVMLALFLRSHRASARAAARTIAEAEARFVHPEGLPLVTTQIPLFNEANVAERAIRAAARIDYPCDRHEIQVLDDSTDETREIVDRTVRELQARGHCIVVLRRTDRTGFKAGALAAALRVATGEFLAIFDADFVPPPRFLRDTLPFFLADDRMGLVQARWGHLNADDSVLTRAQAIGIDGHFTVEQSARTFNGLLMNFNGTAGIWRRRAILDAGGWSADTLTEDLDLSYRAQLAGWRTHFLSELEVPGELPDGVAAFKSQQFRWAKGSIQTAKKLLPRLWRDRDRSVWVKIQATLHLTHYAVHPLMLVVALFTLPAMLVFPAVFSPGFRLLLAAAMLVSTVGPNALYVVSQRALYPDWRHRLRWFPLLMGVGVGLALSNSRAVAEALSGKQSEFVRTPKSGGRARQRYRVRTPILPWIELLLGLYCAVSLGAYVGLHRYVLGPFLLIYAGGFFLTGWLGLREARLQRVASLAATRIPAAPASSPAADQRTPPRAALPLPASAPLALRSWRRPEVYGSAAAPEKS